MSKTKPTQPLSQAAEIDLPEGWAIASLCQLVSPSKEKVEPRERPDAPYLSLEHIESGTGRVVGRGVGSDAASKKAVFRAGDVLYGKLRPYLNKVCVPNFDGICSTDILVFPQSEFVDSHYLFRFLMLPGVVEFANHNMSGVQLPRISFEKMGELELPVAPLAEQKRIVAEVEALLERVNAARAKLAKLPAILKRFRQSILAAACSGQLTAEWREDNDAEPADHLLRVLHTKARAVLGKKYEEPTCPEAEEEFALPPGWAFAGIGSLLSVERRGMKTGPFGTALKKSEHQAKGVPVLGIENIGPMRFEPGSKIHITPEKAAELAEYDAQPDDILISRSGTVGEVCVVPKGLGEARISTNIMRICLAKDSMLPQLFCFIFNGAPFVLSQVARLCGGSTRDFLNQTILLSIRFPLPPLGEQREIVKRVEVLFALAEGIEVHTNAASVRADRLRQAILARAFRGELVSTEAELAAREGREYESASVLLERIKEARKQHKPAKREPGGKNMAKRSTGSQSARKRKPLDEVLREQGKPLTPERLFDLAGFDEGSVDGFYMQLRKLIQDGKVRENRPNKTDVTLEAMGI
jgi:type I restriction enzyme, S subunit